MDYFPANNSTLQTCALNPTPNLSSRSTLSESSLTKITGAQLFSTNGEISTGDGSSKCTKISIIGKTVKLEVGIPVEVNSSNPKKIESDSLASMAKSSRSLPERCVVFIRDVPNPDRPRLCKLLVDSFQQKKIYPVYVYSLIELLKYPQNVERIQKLGLRERWKKTKTPVKAQEIPEILTTGCSALLLDLFFTALHNPPNLMIMDYLSESLVDMDEIFELAQFYKYDIFMLKQNDPVSKIEEIVTKISELITPLDIHHVTHLQERDMWWHEPSGLYIPHLLPGHQLTKAELANNKSQGDNTEEESVFERFLRSTLDELRDLEKPKVDSLPGVVPSKSNPHLGLPKGISEAVAASETLPTKTETFLAQAAQNYIDKFKEILPELQTLDNLAQVKRYFELRKNSEVQLVRMFECRTKQLSMAVIRDSKSLKNPTRRRLYDIFIEEALSKSFVMHAVPCGELVASSEFSELVTKFALSTGILDTITAYSTIFLGLFKILIKKHEKVIALDSIDSQLVGIEGFLHNAKENRFRVDFCERNQDRQSGKAVIWELLDNLQHRHGLPVPQQS